jgi:glutaconate CoA-transferase subunit B
VRLEDVRAEMGWDPRVSPDLTETEPPTPEELRLLREELDPQGIYRS